MSHLERKIKTSVYYKLLNPVQKEIIISKTNRKHLKRGLREVKKEGFEKWKKTTTFSDHNKNIIQEITLKPQNYGTN